MVIFHSYVSLPEGIGHDETWPRHNCFSEVTSAGTGCSPHLRSRWKYPQFEFPPTRKSSESYAFGPIHLGGSCGGFLTCSNSIFWPLLAYIGSIYIYVYIIISLIPWYVLFQITMLKNHYWCLSPSIFIYVHLFSIASHSLALLGCFLKGDGVQRSALAGWRDKYMAAHRDIN